MDSVTVNKVNGMAAGTAVDYSALKAQAQAMAAQLVAWRRDFHMHPELGFQELRTAGIVAAHLQSLGLEVSTGIGKTGVVALVEPDRLPAGAPTVMLRFDMDALPIDEVSDAPYRSQTPGVMHACGHDGHTAIGMGVASLLSANRNQLAGRVKLVFQPAEEGLGGARAMLADGVFDAPTPAAAFGLHLWSQLPTNTVVVQEGPLWAAADVVTLTVTGKAGHGALPHQTVDALLVAAQIVLAWQTVVSRSVDPMQPAVVSVGKIAAGTAPNVIAGEAQLAGSIRSLDPEVRALIVRRLEEIAAGICAAHGASYRFALVPGVPATRNSAAGAALMRDVALNIVAPEQVTQITPMMVGEDMSEFLNRAPGCFVLVGAADPEQPLPAAHHNERFDFDERMLPTGAGLLAGAALEYLQRAQGAGNDAAPAA